MKPPLVGGDAKWPLEEAMLYDVILPLYDVMFPVEEVIFPPVVRPLLPRGGGVSDVPKPER